MDITFGTQDIFASKRDGIIVFTYEERSAQEAAFQTKYGKSISVARDKQEFRGKKGEFYLEKQAQAPRFALVAGLGKKADVTSVIIRQVAGAAAVQVRDMGAASIAIEVPKELDAEEVGQAVTEGVLLATYQYTRYKTEKLDELKTLDTLEIVSDRTGVGVKRGLDVGRIIAESCNMTRDLQNTPSQDLTPELFADLTVKMAKKEKLKYKVFDRKALEKNGFGGILAVGRGSVNEPRLVQLEWSPKNAKKTMCVVGKGITFDTGGISLKPGKKMADMKFDMSGAANVVGIMRNVARLNLPVRVVGLMALAENMPSGGAYKPGDVVKTKSGKTVDVDNTDAEGRIVLADALYYGSTFNPDMMINMATLTGAVIVCLGDKAAGLMGNDDGVVSAIKAAADLSGERVWELPLWDEYEKDIESVIADVRNVGVPMQAGTITAGMFLKHFVDETPWAHLDIAGVAWADSRDVYFSKTGNGTAFGVRLVTQLLRSS